MKKQTKINYILTLILVFCIGASIPVLTGSSQVTEQHSAKSEVPYCVTSPTVPAQVTFDGETIDLRRYDRRERMDREMMGGFKEFDLSFLDGDGKIDRPQNKPCGLYNAMIAPLVPFTVKGFLWYQGETNAGAPEGPFPE